MFRRLIWCFLLFVLLIPAAALGAQGAPQQIDAALADLGQRLGQTITLNSPLMSNWRWSQDNYPDASLGCPQPGAAYAQVVTSGYRFLLTYNGIIYDYRVSSDGGTVLLCSQVNESEVDSATATPVSAETVDTAIPCTNPESGVVYLPTRLIANIQARIVSGPPNNQRSDASVDSDFLGEIPGGAVVQITGGPQCAEGLVWWQVNYEGRSGWTVEGRDGSYWIEPLPAAPLPFNLAPITSENAATVMELSRVEGNLISTLAVSPDGQQVAVIGGRGTNGVWIYDLAALDQPPRLLRGTVQMESLAFSPDGAFLLLGDLNGGVRLWDLSPTAVLLERAFLQGHQADTGAVAYSPDGALIASVGSFAYTTADVDPNNAILFWNAESVTLSAALGGHTARVNALAFSPDSSLLVSASGETTPGAAVDHSVRLWDVAAAAEAAVLSGHAAPVRAIAFSPDGAQIASVSTDGVVLIWDAATRQQVRSLQSPGQSSVALAYSPDGKLLAVAGGDPNAPTPDFDIQVWDIEAGRIVATLRGHTSTVGGLAFNQDGSVLISAGDDRTVRFWGVSGVG